MDSAPSELPADVPSEVDKQLRTMASAVAGAVSARGVARIDFLYEGGDLFVNEVNTIPGSLARKLWIDPVVPFGELLAGMLAEAEQRPTTHWTTAGADGSALRAAGSIAGKLA
jgi:D-alanine-D-alanine ligase